MPREIRGGYLGLSRGCLMVLEETGMACVVLLEGRSQFGASVKGLDAPFKMEVLRREWLNSIGVGGRREEREWFCHGHCCFYF